MKNTTETTTEFNVVIIRMDGSDKRNNRFISFDDAYKFYLEQCAAKNLDNMEQPTDQETAMNLEAGGRGYDYRIELIEEEA